MISDGRQLGWVLPVSTGVPRARGGSHTPRDGAHEFATPSMMMTVVLVLVVVVVVVVVMMKVVVVVVVVA